MATITKGNLVNQALSLLKISGLTREPTPEDMADIIIALEDMVTSWVNDGLNITYNRSSAQSIDPAENSGVSQNNKKAVVYNLAIEAADYFGLGVSARLAGQAESTKRSLYDVVPPVNYQNQFQAAGAGNQYHCADRYYQRFMPRDDRLDQTASATPVTPPANPITGAGASNFDFAVNNVQATGSSLAILNDVLYVQNTNTVWAYSLTGTLISTNTIASTGVVRSITASAAGDFIALEDVSTQGNPQFRFRRLSTAFVLGDTIGPNITTGTGVSLDIVEGGNRDLWLVSNVSDTLRRFNSSGVLQETINISQIGQNPSTLAYVEGDLWVGEENSDTFHRFSQGQFTGDTFAMTSMATFGLVLGDNVFWEGSSINDRIYRRPVTRS